MRKICAYQVFLKNQNLLEIRKTVVENQNHSNFLWYGERQVLQQAFRGIFPKKSIEYDLPESKGSKLQAISLQSFGKNKLTKAT
ncbi:MAG: hypothetical protein C4527_09765 [Candidatus Omnitrophota bacterium]|jgi:hypothetical protein|nr:MAG: hypothetical protein C4527_09765 [Candidatus Omnitrophota bacterium]